MNPNRATPRQTPRVFPATMTPSWSTIFTASTVAFFSVIPLLISLGANRAGRTLCKLYCKALMLSFGIQLTNHGTKPDLPSNTPHVFVANHTSFLDYIVLAGHKFPHAVIMARHQGLIGWLQRGVLAFLNSTAFDREDSQQRQAVKSKLATQLKEQPDCKLLLFPEATCVNNQYVVRFQKGVFDLDITNHHNTGNNMGDDGEEEEDQRRVQICPVAIRYGPETWRSTVFDDNDVGIGSATRCRRRRRLHRRHRLQQQQQQQLTRDHREHRHSASVASSSGSSNSEDDHGWRKDLLHLSSADATEGEDNDEDNDDALQNGWRKDLFRISDDEDDDDQNEETTAGIPPYNSSSSSSSSSALTTTAATPRDVPDHDWNAVDPYWDTRQSLWQQLFYLMTRWKLEAHVHYLPPQTRRRCRRREKHQGFKHDGGEEGKEEQVCDHHENDDEEEEEEDPVDFANRIRLDIAKTAQLKVAEFNGRDKKLLLKLMDQQQKGQDHDHHTGSSVGRVESSSCLSSSSSSSSSTKRSSSEQSMDEGYGSSLRLNSLAMTSGQ
ncbi:1-acylglycerol-3-phosphate O-acyltransferase 6 (lysophosphatidic acid acyltransferase, zeta) [Actinomortierella ambigua]|nr:1-acylglycerol-3-phosphate O-acyltransferase 6 (lysophosphatidic acid acyltransferase, zeta) [Actinomortierella ambigua]